jgi:hypothetical protein
LGGVDVFEKPKDENSSDELIAVKNEICDFINEKNIIQNWT